MIGAILIAFFVAKLKGYRINLLFKSWEIYPVLFFELLYWYMQLAIMKDDYSFVQWSSELQKLYLLSFLILIIKHRLYYSAIIGSIGIFIGSILNTIVIKANDGKMPVFPSVSYLTGYIQDTDFYKIEDIHILGNDSVKLKFLSDIFDTGFSVLSIGDILIKAFAFILIFSTIECLNINNQVKIYEDINMEES